MNLSRCLVLSCLLGSVLFGLASSAGAAPWINLINFQRIDADPNNPYLLTDENGPWVIMATTFRGDDAAQRAQRLVYELRKSFKLSAYSHSAVFDYTESFVGRGVDKYGDPRKMRHRNRVRLQEVAVLVGDYPSVDDPQARKDLKTIKRIKPQSLASDKIDESAPAIDKLRNQQRDWQIASGKKKLDGAMRLAFITTNPRLPAEYFRPRGMDKFVERLNHDKKHSLLECPGRYTVRVASFNGYAVVNPQTILAAEQNRGPASRLESGANKAHKLTIALRAKGYEAYQFHNRTMSMVTVGSFYSPPRHRPDGTIQYEPQVQNLIQRFNAKPRAPGVMGRGGQVAPTQPGSLLGIAFDVHPTLIEVPKRSFGSDYAQRPLTLR